MSTSKKVKMYASERLRTVSHFRVKWYVNGLSAEFDGFKLKMSSQENVSKTFEIVQLFKERTIDVEIDLSSKEV